MSIWDEEEVVADREKPIETTADSNLPVHVVRKERKENTYLDKRVSTTRRDLLNAYLEIFAFGTIFGIFLTFLVRLIW